MLVGEAIVGRMQGSPQPRYRDVVTDISMCTEPRFYLFKARRVNSYAVHTQGTRSSKQLKAREGMLDSYKAGMPLRRVLHDLAQPLQLLADRFVKVEAENRGRGHAALRRKLQDSI